jgi:hypothetical protein
LKIARVKHHGQARYRVSDPQGPNGKRQRHFFANRTFALQESPFQVVSLLKANGYRQMTISISKS